MNETTELRKTLLIRQAEHLLRDRGVIMSSR